MKPNQKDGTILIVDDHADNREVYATLLEYAGYEVIEAGSGRQAVRLAVEHRPDLVIMDLMMPIMDGWEATDALKNDRRTEHIPVLALSAFEVESSDPSDVLRPAGFCGFLPKPVAPKTVLRAVEVCIVKAREGQRWVSLEALGAP